MKITFPIPRISLSEKDYLNSVVSFSEAGKYLKKFQNKIFVIKYGGNALTDKYFNTSIFLSSSVWPIVPKLPVSVNVSKTVARFWYRY